MSDYLPGKLLMIDENGNEMEVQGTLTINEEPNPLSIDEKIPSLDGYVTHNSMSIDIDGSMTLSRKKFIKLLMSIDIDGSMTLSRKKFIKLLMSKGIGRNGANEMAKHVLKKNGRYTMIDLLMW